MQHSSATIEEQLLLKSIREECPWENLPKRLQSTFTSKEEWHKRIMDHCIKKRLQWNSCFARKVCKEGEYYEGMMHYLRKNLALFPYHLAEYICRVMRISPFRYYCDMIFEVMKNEQPYDSIPNFSAADALRLTGIGRNEFIDVMNKCRSKKIMWKLNKSIAKDLLPTQPVEFSIEPWWGVCLVNFTLEEFKKLTEEETATIDKICKEETNSFFLFDGNVIKGLHRRGLIYFDVPVYPEDYFKVSRLEGFVSNREQSYEDPIEELLYAVFVVSSENATVAELAATLQADLPQLQAAASFACRLGWAVKMIDPASILRDANIPGSPHNLSDEDDDSNASVSSINMSVGISPGTEVHRSGSGLPRVAFIVDANITSYLMMGSISPGLKSHAVTLYEAGKLGHASISDLCKDLTALEGKKFEGELQEFANHAFSLRSVLECLQSGGTDICPGLRDKINLHSLINDTDRPPQTNSSIYDISRDMQSEIKAPESDDLFSGDDLEIPQIETCSSEYCTQNPSDDASLKGSPEQLSNLVHDIKINENMLDGKDSVSSRGSLADSKKIKKTYLVNILRCESLASLAPATLDRLFLRDYDIVVSMAPLPSSSVLPGASGPVHFGPASYASMTPWMKLVLYTSVGNGPLSVVLMKGQCLRMLPAPLVGCEKALIWSWDGSVIGGLGGKFEGCLINGNILLHCINSMLKCSAVLVQPLYKCDLDKSGKTMTIDVPLPLKNSDGSVANVGVDMGLHEEEISKLNTLLGEISLKIELWTVGYVRLLKLQKERESDDTTSKNDQHEWVPLSLEFGIPLFNPDLTNKICARVVSSHILQTDSLDVHHNEMQSLRKKLRDICSEYQATGPTAKLFYHREQPKEPPRQLMNFASGKWNPFVEPAALISGASNEHQRLKLGNRHRFRQEVLSFDGNILRSYALVPVYEAATRTIEESASTISVKVESDDADSREVVLPGVNLLFDGSQLHPFDITACLQARQPICLVADASAASAAIHAARVSHGRSFQIDASKDPFFFLNKVSNRARLYWNIVKQMWSRFLIFRSIFFFFSLSFCDGLLNADHLFHSCINLTCICSTHYFKKRYAETRRSMKLTFQIR